MRVRTVLAATVALVLVGTTAGCTQTVAGTPGPRPSVSGGGDFPSGFGSATDGSSDGSSDTPTDDPTDGSSTPSADPSASGTTGGDSDQFLCDRIEVATQQGSSVTAQEVKDYVSAVILAWGLVAGDDDPYAKADPVTTATCPDVRAAVLKLMGLPDLKSTEQ